MKVRKIRDGNGAVLIEWRDVREHLHRGWIPPDALDEDLSVKDEVLAKAAPYGLPFETFLPAIVIKPEDLATALRRRQVWTYDDVMRNPKSLSVALLECMGFHVAQIQTSVREFDKT